MKHYMHSYYLRRHAIYVGIYVEIYYDCRGTDGTSYSRRGAYNIKTATFCAHVLCTFKLVKCLMYTVIALRLSRTT